VLGYGSGGRALAVLANRGRRRLRPEKWPGNPKHAPVAETAPAPRLSSCGRAPWLISETGILFACGPDHRRWGRRGGRSLLRRACNASRN